MKQYLEEMIEAQVVRMIFSNPIKDAKYQKVILRPVTIKSQLLYQSESFLGEQVFHKNISEEELLEELLVLSSDFKQIDAETVSYHFHLKVSKKGKVFFNKREEEYALDASHNRKKQYLLEEGIVIPALVDLGIMNEEGIVYKSKYDKYRQINRFVEMVDDAIQEVELEHYHIVDFGCGKSYLTFVLYHYLKNVLQKEVSIHGIDLKEDVIIKCNELAKKYEYSQLEFFAMDIEDYQSSREVDMVISLHACDTATDIAIYKGISWGAKIMLNVPCCQHEINGQIKSDEFALMTRYGLIQERVSALMTDALRANLIGLCDYEVQLLEFIELEHSPKNILIRSVKKKQSQKKKLYEELVNLLHTYHLNPTLYQLLKEGQYVSPIS